MISGVSGWYTALMRCDFWSLDVVFFHINILRLLGLVVAKKAEAYGEVTLP